jgi:hypothetical protein
VVFKSCFLEKISAQALSVEYILLNTCWDIFILIECALGIGVVAITEVPFDVGRRVSLREQVVEVPEDGDTASVPYIVEEGLGYIGVYVLDLRVY